MKCRYCNIALAPLRSLTDGEFCCDEHRHTFHAEQATVEAALSKAPAGSLLSLHAAITSVAPEPAQPVSALAPSDFQPKVRVPHALLPAGKLQDQNVGLRKPDQLLPLYFEQRPAESNRIKGHGAVSEPSFRATPRLPQANTVPVVIEVQTEGEPMAVAPKPEDGPETSAREIATSWRWITDAWKNAPTDLRTITLLLPVLLAVAVSGSVPKVKIPRTAGGVVPHVMADGWKTLHQNILNRAAVEYADDFRSGLDAWDSHSNLTTSWSYDATGFVQPGPLAIFKPTVDLTDYRFEFLGEIDQKGMGAAFRAADLNNYYAVKFVVVKPGPLPLVHLVRYAVIDGQEGPHLEKALPITARTDMLYRVLLDIRGSDFTILVQGQVVDFWSDNRLRHGGVGFFCSRGEKARVRWLEVSHQYDTLGRLCAYLAPFGVEGRNGNLN